MKMFHAVSLSVAIAIFAMLQTFQPSARAQSSTGSGTTNQSQTQTQPGQTAPTYSSSNPQPIAYTYHRPSDKEKLKNYAFDTFGPYAIFGAVAIAGIQQAESPRGPVPGQSGIPPDWGQGWDSYGARVGSDFGIHLITQTARYSMAQVFREDTIYYRCECSGIVPRLKHALISTVTARRGDDGHRTFSFSQIAAPYAGAEAAALLWYPSRYNAMDGFRMGNYNLLIQAGFNVALEFIYGGPHTLLSQHHVPIVSSVTGSNNKQ
jgi:hypothetical protein